MPLSHGTAFVLGAVGIVFDYAGATAPDGFLFCYGQAVSRTDYGALFAVIGEAFGKGDGSTTFNLPDCRGRAVSGKDDMGGAAASRLTTAASGINGVVLGAAGGAQSVVLDITQMPSHSHTSLASQNSSGGASGYPMMSNTTSVNGVTPAGTIGNAGGGLAHNNVQPTIILNKIIKY